MILILGILAGLLVTQLSSSETATRVQQTRQLLVTLETVLEDYSQQQSGDYPPSSFTPEQGVPSGGTNEGVEALVVALYSDGWEAGGLLPDLADRLVNTDLDHAPSNLTDFATRALLEIPDAWENPIAYFHRRDYEAAAAGGQLYRTFAPATGDEILSSPRPFRNGTTGRFYRARRFQLVSAGPDGAFGTQDDIANFEVDEER